MPAWMICASLTRVFVVVASILRPLPHLFFAFVEPFSSTLFRCLSIANVKQFIKHSQLIRATIELYIQIFHMNCLVGLSKLSSANFIAYETDLFNETLNALTCIQFNNIQNQINVIQLMMKKNSQIADKMLNVLIKLLYEPFDAVFTVKMRFEMLMPLLFVCAKMSAFNPIRSKHSSFENVR